MIFYSGDIHGDKKDLIKLCRDIEPKPEDTIVLLGDVGANYYASDRDKALKGAMRKQSATFLCIHGNHEIRPANIPSYKMKEWNGGIVWYEEDYPNILFAKDGEIFDIEGLKHLVIGGAYSVDRDYRILNGYGWWPDEQPSEEIKQYVEEQINKEFDVVVSHTCPYRYEPREVFLPFINQNTVDTSTEKWLEEIEQKIDYRAWFCGYWHIDKRIDKMHFLFHSVESSEQFKR